MSVRSRALLTALCIAAALAGGCRRTAPSASGIHQAKKSELSAAELKYGLAPVPDTSVVYQPAVVIVGGGAEAVRALSPTGLTWTINAHAPHADELAEGKIIFLTNRAVGRVLDLRKDGDNLSVTVGPVLITDVIRQADITVAMPIDFGEAIAYTAPDLPGLVIPAKESAEARPLDGGVEATPVAFQAQTQPAPAPTPDVSNLVHFKVVPTADSRGIGLQATSNGGGLKMRVEALVYLAKPTLDAHLRITGDGHLEEANLELTGAAGLTLQFEAGTDVGMRANVNGRLQSPIDFSIPVLGGPVPLALTMRQQMIIKTALGVRNSTLTATGDYTFRGGFKIGYADKKWGVFAPTGFSQRQTLMETAGGVSIAASGVNISHQMKVVFGVGAFGFATGPYFALNSSAGLFKGSDLGMIPCQEATIVISMSGGIGYLIPRPVADVINFVLGELHVRYRVASEGGLSSDPLTIINSSSTLPGCKVGKGA